MNKATVSSSLGRPLVSQFADRQYKDHYCPIIVSLSKSCWPFKEIIAMNSTIANRHVANSSLTICKKGWIRCYSNNMCVCLPNYDSSNDDQLFKLFVSAFSNTIIMVRVALNAYTSKCYFDKCTAHSCIEREHKRVR